MFHPRAKFESALLCSTNGLAAKPCNMLLLVGKKPRERIFLLELFEVGRGVHPVAAMTMLACRMCSCVRTGRRRVRARSSGRGRVLGVRSVFGCR